MSTTSQDAPGSASHPRHRWRENIEALVMAVVVALLFKYFILEISKIPSGSMQPTLMGSPETAVFDRTLVDKLSFQFRDPERFEIVVFKHPLERSRIMVKRLVGLPGEDLKIEGGDLWVRANEQEPWRILRRPPSVQRALWKRVVPRDPRLPNWTVVQGGAQWTTGEDSIQAHGAGKVRFREGAGPIIDNYADGYPEALEGKIVPRDPHWGQNVVGDVRLEGELRAQEGTSAIVFELTEGQRVYEFRLPGPAAPAGEGVTVKIRDSIAETERVERGSPLRLAGGTTYAFALENLDDRLAFELDGARCLEAEIEPNERQNALLTIVLDDGAVELSALRVLRDVYYLTRDGRRAWSISIPPGSYVMLGDNTQDSADSRLWDAITFTLAQPEGSEPATVRGNFRLGENPYPDGAQIRCRDYWGEVHWFERGLVTNRTHPGNSPLVPRELILGRALAVFWPIRPFQGLWRVGWLH